MLSVIFEQGAIIDGERSVPFRTDVGIVDERIALIGDLADRESVTRIPCHGLMLAPGFIDVHSHSDEGLLHKSQLANKLLQGCTTHVVGLDGRSAAARATEAGVGFDAFGRAVQRAEPALNVAAFVGADDALAGGRDATTLLRDAWDGGAFGISTARIDDAAVRAIIDASGAQRLAVRLDSHVDRFATELDAAIAFARDRALHVGALRIDERRTGAALYRALERLEEARDRATPVSADTFPYVAECVEVETLIPRRVWEPAFADDATFRAAAALVAIAFDARYERTILRATRDEGFAPWYGRSIAEYASARRASPERAVLELLRDNDGVVSVFLPQMREAELQNAFSAPFVFAGTNDDAFGASRDDAALVHPRAFGTMPRLLRRFAEQLRTMPTQDAVARMTSEAADAFGIRARGRISPGCFADIVVYDGKIFADMATYAQPRAFPVGLVHVFVNGRAAVRDGELTGTRAGQFLTRGTK